jgi:hypothetical protein
MTGCNKSDDDGGDQGQQGGAGGESFTASINGSDFAASTDFETLISAQMTNGVLVAQGSTNSGNFINFSIINYSGTGTYTSGDNLTNSNSMQYGEVNGTAVSSWGSNLETSAVGGLTPGEIIITSDANGVVEGTFSFEGYNAADMSSKMITSGRFKANVD